MVNQLLPKAITLVFSKEPALLILGVIHDIMKHIFYVVQARGSVGSIGVSKQVSNHSNAFSNLKTTL